MTDLGEPCAREDAEKEDLASESAAVTAIKVGLKDKRLGRVRPAREALTELRKKLGL